MNTKKIIYLLLLCLSFHFAVAQNNSQKAYIDSLTSWQKNYVSTHEVVKGKDKKHFRFYKPTTAFGVLSSFEKIKDTTTVAIKTTGKKIPQKYFIRYGKIKFAINFKVHELTIFQSKDLMNNPDYKDYLFIPFTDSTSGKETYGSGRYIDLQTSDIKNGMVFLDFNKAYNPYCAYSDNFNCPIPPKENALKVSIRAGEKVFAKGH